MSPLLSKLTGTSTAKLTDLNPLIDAINNLMTKHDTLRADFDALKAEIAARRAEDRLGKLETYAKNNSARIDEMESRYDGVVDEMNVIATGLTKAVAELEATDEASGWKKWKEQRREQRASASASGTNS